MLHRKRILVVAVSYGSVASIPNVRDWSAPPSTPLARAPPRTD